jgi:hypothetical protein
VYILVIIEKKVAGNIDILVNEEYRPDSDTEGLLLVSSGSHVELTERV